MKTKLRDFSKFNLKVGSCDETTEYGRESEHFDYGFTGTIHDRFAVFQHDTIKRKSKVILIFHVAKSHYQVSKKTVYNIRY